MDVPRRPISDALDDYLDRRDGRLLDERDFEDQQGPDWDGEDDDPEGENR